MTLPADERCAEIDDKRRTEFDAERAMRMLLAVFNNNPDPTADGSGTRGAAGVFRRRRAANPMDLRPAERRRLK
jgi:hypothetical protein